MKTLITTLLLLASAVSMACNNPEGAATREATAPGETATVSAPAAIPAGPATAAPTRPPAEKADAIAPATKASPDMNSGNTGKAADEAELERVTEEVLARHHRAVVENAPGWVIATHLEKEEEIHACLVEHAKRRIAGTAGDDDRELQDCVLTTIQQEHANKFFSLLAEEREQRLRSLIGSVCNYGAREEQTACLGNLGGLTSDLVNAKDHIELHKLFTEGYFGKLVGGN